MDERTLVRTMAERAAAPDDGWEALLRIHNRRRRRRRLGGGVVAMTVIAALAWTTLSLAHLGHGARPADPTPTVSPPTGTPGLGGQTSVPATADGITVRVPEGWSLVQLPVTGGSEGDWPDLELANFEPELDPSRLCPSAPQIPPNGVVAYVERHVRPSDSAAYSPYPPGESEFIERPGPCGQGAWSQWRVGDRFFEAGVIAGPQASESDRGTALDALLHLDFTHVAVQDTLRSTIDEIESAKSEKDRAWGMMTHALWTTPSLALADLPGGGLAGTLMAMEDSLDVVPGPGPAFLIQMYEGDGVTKIGLARVSSDPPLAPRIFSIDDGTGLFHVTLFGSFSPETARVVASTENGDREGSLLTVGGLGETLRFFVLDLGTRPGTTHLSALDSDGSPVGETRVEIPTPSESPTRQTEPERLTDEVTILSGVADEVPWAISAVGTTNGVLLTGTFGDLEIGTYREAPVGVPCGPSSFLRTPGGDVHASVALVAVPTDAERGFVTLANGTTVDGTVVPLPPEVATGFQVFAVVLGEGQEIEGMELSDAGGDPLPLDACQA